MNYQKLFDHMQSEHGLTLLQSEMLEIIYIVREMDKPNGQLSGIVQGWPLLRETAMRANLALPETEQDLQWFDEGVSVKNSGDFMERLFESLDLGQPSVTSEGSEKKACAKDRWRSAGRRRQSGGRAADPHWRA